MVGEQNREFSVLAQKLEDLNHRLEAENAKMRRAIVLLTDVVDEILPFLSPTRRSSIG